MFEREETRMSSEVVTDRQTEIKIIRRSLFVRETITKYLKYLSCKGVKKTFRRTNIWTFEIIEQLRYQKEEKRNGTRNAELVEKYKNKHKVIIV